MINRQDKQKELDIEEQDREYPEEASLVKEGLAQPPLGPSDSSDSGSDLPAAMPDTDSDRFNTGERAEVENDGDGPIADDIVPDEIVPEDEAGVSYTPPDPERNGGRP